MFVFVVSAVKRHNKTSPEAEAAWRCSIVSVWEDAELYETVRWEYLYEFDEMNATNVVYIFITNIIIIIFYKTNMRKHLQAVVLHTQCTANINSDASTF